MGNKLHAPVVPFGEAVAGLKRLGQEGAVQALFSSVTTSGRASDTSVPMAAMVDMLGEALGPVGSDVVERLYQVLDSDGSRTISFEEFVSSVYVLRHGTMDQRLRLVFNMFDLSADGYVSKKEFTTMALCILLANQPKQFEFTTAREDGVEVTDTHGMEYFKPLTDMMVEMAMLEFDRDGDGKLSFEEWKRFGADDPDVANLLSSMQRFGVPPTAAPASHGRPAYGAGAGAGSHK